MFNYIHRLYHPDIFQGKSQNGYFEGWYFKQVAADQSRVAAVIPGISHSGESHAFIQYIDSEMDRPRYYSFPPEQFSYSRRDFRVRIGSSIFTRDYMTLDISRDDESLKGEIEFRNLRPYPVSALSPGIMGWYAFVPFMECYHGVVSMRHTLSGWLDFGGKTTDFTGGAGYIEKDWGTSFPSTWIWAQSNNFSDREASFMLSVAKIPWLGNYFTGHLCFLWIAGKLYRLMTYTGSKIEKISLDSDSMNCIISDKQHRIKITARNSAGGELKAPVSGKMDRVIKESLDADIHIVLENSDRDVIFEGHGRAGGFEFSGDMGELISGI